MENSDNIQPDLPEEDDSEGIFFSDPVIDAMLESARWAKLISIIGFIFSSLIAVFAFGVSALLPAINNMAARSGGAPIPAGSMGTIITIYYLVIALICFLFYAKLYRYAVNAKSAMDNSSQFEVEKAFGQLSGFFKYWGILTIVVAGMILMSIVGIVLGGGLR